MNDLFLRAMHNEKIERPPVWLMRQAGRYMSEYLELRQRYSFLDLCRNPAAATEAVLQPLNVFKIDAAILFSDILITFDHMGLKTSFNPAPVIENPVRTEADVNKLNSNIIGEMGYITDIYKSLKKSLQVPLIGFSGAPFTLACYAVEGKGSKHFENLKSLMYNSPKVFNTLMEKLSDTVINYLNMQVDNGADVLQLFDTWANSLNEEDYNEFVFPHLKRVSESLKSNVPVIYYSGEISHYKKLSELKFNALSVGKNISLSTVDRIHNGKFILQGNLDNITLATSLTHTLSSAEKILEESKQLNKNLIFNLSHGIIPSTPRENVDKLTNLIHDFRY